MGNNVMAKRGRVETHKENIGQRRVHRSVLWVLFWGWWWGFCFALV